MSTPRIKVVRDAFTTQSTLGKMFLDGKEFCNTLEQVVRAPGIKIPKLTAIPEGVYEVVFAYSGHFERNVPHLKDVPGFSEIEIHIANFPKDVKGCLGLGFTRSLNFVGMSGKAIEEFEAWLHEALKADKMYIEITSETNGRGVYPASDKR